ncbi:helix-turn-helix domain-containing protein [Phocaeicola coprophilus]|uniref:helix-turn-helix domain-containing protein n=1 Tax=Phocaeicola coprophilus TaxID=387090 RepID=UPI0022E21F50|nr:AraC family transcriptional regulator [Phocaeicola coprophilus]
MHLFINKVHLFINKNYQNNIALEDIACNVGMNPSALCRYYKKHTGKRMFEYLTELRISYATKLLINKNINISQVAYDCGYNSLSHFNHQFKQVTGYTPSEYAQKL